MQLVVIPPALVLELLEVQLALTLPARVLELLLEVLPMLAVLAMLLGALELLLDAKAVPVAVTPSARLLGLWALDPWMSSLCLLDMMMKVHWMAALVGG